MNHGRPLYTVIPTMTLAGVVVVLIGIGVFAYPVTAATPTGVQAPAANTADYLPDISLTNQYGKTVSLASLKGKPLLVSFIHTSCKGVCELMTAKMKTVSTDLGTNGTNVTMVSISTDPDDDGPRQL
ncbi:MAG TPA: SCO family protein, partial [Candidatus Binataceae bacterium]|nr:SCO family protein [Candidatus Binataceae bacterium]